MTRLALCAACWLVGFAVFVTGSARAVTLTFDELAFQPVDNLSFQGVTFDFKVGGTDSVDAFYNSYGPGTLVLVEDPSLTGNSTGILTLDFDVPTPLLQFGVALNTGDPLSPGFTVGLFDAAFDSLGTTPVDTVSTGGPSGFSEGLFDYAGPPVARAVIDFADAPGNFAFDNLTYGIPEPSTLVTALLGALLMVIVHATRRAG